MCHNKKKTGIIWHVPKGVGSAVDFARSKITLSHGSGSSGGRDVVWDVKGVVFKASGDTDGSKKYCGKLGSSAWLRLRVYTQLWGTRVVVTSSCWNLTWKALKAALRSLRSIWRV